MHPDDVVERLRRLPFGDIGDALVDHHRSLRQGLPETVYGPGKSPDQVARIVAELIRAGSGPVLLTRATDEQLAAALEVDGGGRRLGSSMLWREPAASGNADVLVMSAGTADQPVVDE